jgi:sugar-specific transcriptional regulator TrmB
MVRASLGAPTVYAAVDLDTAFEAALTKHESELREMEERKRELQELSRQQPFPSVEEVATFKIIKNMKELVGVSLSRAASIKVEQVFVLPSRALPIGALAGITDAFKKLVARGVRVRGIVDISSTDPSWAGTELVQELLDGGVDVRCLDEYHGLYFSVSDRKTCASIINVDVQRTSLSAPTTAVWADDRTYARYLTATFELLWAQAVPAEQRIKELLDERPRTLSR